MQNEQTTKKPKNNGKLLGIGLAAMLAVAALFSGVQFGQGGIGGESPLEASIFSFLYSKEKPDTEADLGEFWRVWNLLEEKFVTSSPTSTPDQTTKLRGAIAGMVDSYGDPYTVYMPPEDASYFAEDISGNFSGVGMEVGLRDGLITIIAPLPDSPALGAGIQTGDIITKIDDTSTDRMNVDEAVRLIRGEAGTEVTLMIYREGEVELLEKKIIRQVINIPTLDTETKDNAFVIKLYSFNGISESKMREAIAQFEQSGKNNLILDLRGNPGGFLESAVTIAGYFLPAGKVVVRENFGEGKEEDVYRTQGQKIFGLNPDNFVVLIDGGSASASEILAGALSEHGVATTIGDTTFGKGSVQELVNLPDKSALKVTIARWLTPEGVSFSEGGLEPNVYIPRTPQEVMAGEDKQMEAAIKWLKGDKSIGEKLGVNF